MASWSQRPIFLHRDDGQLPSGKSVRKEGKIDMKHECAGKVGDGGDHSGRVEVGTRRKQAGLAADAQKVRFDRWRIPGQGKGGSCERESSKPLKICQCSAE